MKKNAMLKIAAILMVAVLLTTCAISSTFAKYVTKDVDATTNTAQVAKWGLNIEAKSDAAALFLDAYDGTVKAEGNYFVVAPGTNNGNEGIDLLNYKLTGKPEVSFKLVATVNLVLSDNWTANSEFYCPLKFTVGDKYVNGADAKYVGDVTTFKKDVEALIAEALLGEVEFNVNDGKYYSKNAYAANTDVSTIKTAQKVKWEWAFDVSDDYDELDTELGNAAATGTAPTIKFDLKLGAEQVD